MNNCVDEVQDNGSEVPSELVVSTTEDENDGDFSTGDLSLREAIALSNQQLGADTITFDNSLSGETINNSQEGELLISDSLSIIGLGKDNLTVNGGFVFNIAQSNIDVAIDGLNIAGGTVDNSGNLTLSNSQIRETLNINGSSDYYALISRENVNIINSSIRDNDGGDNVGVVIESGTATVEGSTIANNSGVLGAAGIIINSDATADIRNSTIANNSSRSGGGVANAGTVDISNSTIVDNQGGRTAGGIINRGDANVTSSIVANNTGNNGTFAVGDVYNVTDDGVFTSGGNNLIGNGDDATGFIDGVNGDLVGSDGDDPLNRQLDLLIDPNLGELQNNGGSTETFALLAESPAIDRGSNPNNLATDQRGEGFDRTVGNGTDIGAYEVQDDGTGVPNELVVSTLEDENDGDFSAGDLSLREAIALSNQQLGADTITFDNSLSSGTIVFDSSLSRNLNIDDSLVITGLGQDNLTLDGGFIFDVTADTDFAIDGLNLTGSKINSNGNLTLSNSTISQTVEIGSVDNSAIISRGNVTIIDSTIKDNRGGGNVGILFESGTGTIERSAITGNDSTDYAQSGVIIRNDVTVDISNSTIANNKARSIGGISNAGTVNITNSTIANNTGGLLAGGINNSVGGTVTLTSSLLTHNTGSANIGDISGDGEYVSGGNNLIGNGDDAIGFVNGVNGDLVGTNGDDPDNPQNDLLIDPRLGELQNNGGSTETLALLENSPAIDAGSNPNNLATDQRGEGFNRTVGNGTDIGAYEVQNIVSNNEIVGTGNSDFLEGTAKDDIIKGLDGNDFIKGLEGSDRIFGGNGDDFLDGGKGADKLYGDAGNDVLFAGDDFDLLNGGEGNDRIFGEAGDDRFLASNSGRDLFTGGTGGDIYVYNLNADAGFFDQDIVLDFKQSEDKIAFRPLVNDSESLDSFADLDTNGSGILDKQDNRVRVLGNSTVIDFSDLFGRSSGSDTITLVGGSNLNSDNFLFNETVVGTEFG